MRFVSSVAILAMLAYPAMAETIQSGESIKVTIKAQVDNSLAECSFDTASCDSVGVDVVVED